MLSFREVTTAMLKTLGGLRARTAVVELPGRHWDDFDLFLPAYSSLGDLNHHMSRIRLEAISLLDRLELILGGRPSPVSRSS